MFLDLWRSANTLRRGPLPSRRSIRAGRQRALMLPDAAERLPPIWCSSSVSRPSLPLGCDSHRTMQGSGTQSYLLFHLLDLIDKSIF